MTAIPTPTRQERPSRTDDDNEPPTKLDPLVEAALLQHGKALGTFQESHDRLIVETVRMKAGLAGVKRSVDALGETMRTSSKETQDSVAALASQVSALTEGMQNLTAFVKQLVGKS